MALNSNGYKYARKAEKDFNFKIKRLKLLLLRISTRIEKINIYLGYEDLKDKEVKEKISLLSSLLEVKKKVNSEIKELTAKDNKSESSLSNIIN